MYAHVSQVPPRRQWEANSSPNQPYNCGPTSVSFVADFYRDATFGIEATRDLGAVHNGDGTSGAEQAVMLAKRGVPCANRAVTLAELKKTIGGGLRPVVIGMLMSRVPAAIRGHSFTGVHAVVARQNAVVSGQTGVLIMDPNFGYGHSVDSTNGARFYPDSIVAGAMAGYTAVVPNSEKETGVGDVHIFLTKFLGSDGKPAPRTVGFLPGVTVTGYALDGTTEKFTAGAGGSSAPSDARAEIVRPTGDTRAPKGAGWIRITAGVFADHPYLVEVQAGVAVPPDPPIGGFTQADIDKAVATNEDKWEKWNTTAQGSKP